MHRKRNHQQTIERELAAAGTTGDITDLDAIELRHWQRPRVTMVNPATGEEWEMVRDSDAHKGLVKLGWSEKGVGE